MAIRLHIQENKVRLKVRQNGTVHLSASEGVPVYPENYTGDYEITPTELEQSLVSHGLMMTDDVSVHAIPSDYVGSAVDRRSSTDITASGATVTVPNGFYEENASKSVQSGNATTPTGGITANPTISVDPNGLITASVSKSESITPIISEGYVTEGTAGTITFSGSNTSQLSTQGATTITPSTSEQTAVSAGKYTTGDVKVGAIPTGTAGTPTATKGTVSGHAVSVTPSVTNTTGWITGSTKTGTAVSVSASELVSGTKSITANGTDIDVTNYAAVDVAVPSQEPSLQAKTNIAPSTSSQTITADNGYDGLSSVQINAMPSGTAGTPTATKGTVSNHSVSVTPSVTNTTGYITGSTKTGTAVSVSASDLVSGTLSITSSGTKDVTNYASASVASGGATASATKGTVSNHSISVTPSVTKTAGYITAGTTSGTAVTVSASELVSGSETKTENGTYDVTNLAELVVNVSGGGGTSKNTQVVQGTTRTTKSAMTAIGAEMTVSKTGTYDIYWSGFRSSTSTSYTYATQLYIDGTAHGSENSTWSNNIQNNHLESVSLTVNQKLRVYGRNSRNSSYYIYAPTLVIVEN